ncbi:5'-AMP-activated protein kinase subunit beta-2 [Clonorchis sinensis]|uniref:5'-AMP-activated protein kinase subunit beta-1 n=2 Tax=Clonorchis sinensis TaxID=79923 RepID=H2KT28_CLOSI|nr:5'-AMP-activated protein kinase subunit beta-2 [Clonorchis sinensis]
MGIPMTPTDTPSHFCGRSVTMGNTPAHHKRRLSGDGEYRLSGTTPTYVSVTIPPMKRRNMHSMTDLSKSAPPDYSEELVEPSPTAVRELLGVDRMAIDEATSMLRAASLRDSINNHPSLGKPATAATTDHQSVIPYPDELLRDTSLRKHRPASTGCPSPTDRRLFLPQSGASTCSSPVTVDRPTTLTQTFARPARRTAQQQRFNHQTPDSELKCPTVFRWDGGGKDIYISGTFNNWEKRIPMVKRNSGVYVIIDCTPGTHEYKYFIDGAWYHDPTKPTVDNGLGTKNNVVHVKFSDFDAIQALELDQANSRHRSSVMESSDPDSMGHSPPGNYGRYIPSHPSEFQRRSGSFGSPGPIAPGIGTLTQPPLLPPHLLQGILNMDTGVHCDPNLLPPPNHVIVNHLYALSIKDGVIVLSVITRYRQKFVSTVFYKPIQD